MSERIKCLGVGSGLGFCKMAQEDDFLCGFVGLTHLVLVICMNMQSCRAARDFHIKTI